MSRIKREYWEQVDSGELYPDMRPKKKNRVGARSQLTPAIERKIQKLNKKTNGKLGIRDLAVELKKEYGIDIAYSTMHRYCVSIGMYNVDSYLKPHLSLKQMVNRINYVVGLLEVHNQHIRRFGTHELTIHIDEKWFYVVPLKRKIRLYPGDEYPGDDTA